MLAHYTAKQPSRVFSRTKTTTSPGASWLSPQWYCKSLRSVDEMVARKLVTTDCVQRAAMAITLSVLATDD